MSIQEQVPKDSLYQAPSNCHLILLVKVVTEPSQIQEEKYQRLCGHHKYTLVAMEIVLLHIKHLEQFQHEASTAHICYG